MPIVKRAIEPVFVSRSKLPHDTKNELECMSTLTLAGVILQLSSLSKHAENLFGELFTETSDLNKRFVSMKNRVDELKVYLETLNPEADDEGTKMEREHVKFKSKQNPKQQILSRNTLPTTMQEQYNRCDPPPGLQLVTPLRDDSKDALKLYTDPNYFINLWIDNENKDYEQRKKRHKERKERRRKNETTKEAKVVKRREFANVDKEFAQTSTEEKPEKATLAASGPSPAKVANDESVNIETTLIPSDDIESTSIATSHTPRTTHYHHGGPPPAPPPEPHSNSNTPPNIAPPRPLAQPPMPPGTQSTQRATPNKPPPSAPLATPINQQSARSIEVHALEDIDQFSSLQEISVVEPEIEIPREPSPPPANIPDPPPDLPEITNPQDFESSVDKQATSSENTADVRRSRIGTQQNTKDSILLEIIRGKELRRVTQEEFKPTASTSGNDVASILLRRIAIGSDSESGDDYSSGEDDWD